MLSLEELPSEAINEARLRVLERHRVKLQSLSRVLDRDEEIAERIESIYIQEDLDSWLSLTN